MTSKGTKIALLFLLPATVMADEDSSAAASPPPPCDVAIVIDRSSMDVSHAGYTGPTSLSCNSVTDVGEGFCADSYVEVASSPQDSTEASMKVLRLRN